MQEASSNGDSDSEVSSRLTVQTLIRPRQFLLCLIRQGCSLFQYIWKNVMSSFGEGSSGADQEDVEEKTREKDQDQGHHKSQAQLPGYAGLINQGATCYLNSILQCLFFTQELQDAVHRCEDQGESSLITQLRRLFEALQEAQGPVSTTAITRCLGLRDGHHQEDALLCFHMLLTRMTAEQRELGQLFQMTLEQVTQCQGCETKTVLEENRLFLVVPVPQGPSGTPCSLDKKSYDLFAVCHHFGDVTGGHYVADIKPSEDHRWYRFSDHSVELTTHPAESRTAYMLMYHQKDCRVLPQSLGPLPNELDPHEALNAVPECEPGTLGEPLWENVNFF
ncbi:uncharacterized protein LOC142424524 isoform X2 [Tenrec ecaudatus]|uniref:uncharacterized protein LOC142424524 isoform X2 n=1 Tax=Tenrec ecaudatus TaxID=94439 RepID=UPI003F5989D5